MFAAVNWSVPPVKVIAPPLPSGPDVPAVSAAPSVTTPAAMVEAPE